jgi:hypothetical protein
MILPVLLLLGVAQFQNDKVIVTEHDLAPGARLEGTLPAVVVAKHGEVSSGRVSS